MKKKKTFALISDILIIILVLSGVFALALRNSSMENLLGTDDIGEWISSVIFGNETEEIEYCDYTVKVVDGLGSPVSNVLVKFTNTNGESKTRVTEKNGIAVLKNAISGSYEVVLEQGLSDATIEKNGYMLTKEQTSLTAIVRNDKKIEPIYGDVANGEYAYYVEAGSYTPYVDGGDNFYMILNVRETGIYRISLESDNSEATIGYYGIPMLVYRDHRGSGDYDGKTFDIIIQDVATPYVLGVISSVDTNAVVNIERIADAPFDPQFEPWTMYEKTMDIDKCDIPDDVTLIDFDVTDPALSVVERDGFYYTTDGKPVYIRITTASAYLPGASLALLAGYVDDNVGINVGAYVYDDEGNFIEKRNYNYMIEDYMEYCDGYYGVVPLTTELAACIQTHGNGAGWWDAQSGNYLFEGVDLVSDNAWLFLCMVEE